MPSRLACCLRPKLCSVVGGREGMVLVDPVALDAERNPGYLSFLMHLLFFLTKSTSKAENECLTE